MSKLSEVAPRLARAHEAELAYQERLRREKAWGRLSFSVATEEMVRSFRKMGRAMAPFVAKERLRREQLLGELAHRPPVSGGEQSPDRGSSAQRAEEEAKPQPEEG